MKKIIFISIGGFCGAILRYIIKNLPVDGVLPFQTLFINTLGCFLLAFVTSLLLNKKYDNAKLGFTVGFCGAFTTFSTVCKESVNYLRAGMIQGAVIYLSLLILFGLFAVSAGVMLANVMNYRGNDELTGIQGLDQAEDEVE